MSTTAGPGVTTLQFRTPQGRIIRRFKADDLVLKLYKFISLRFGKEHTIVSRHPDVKDSFELRTLLPSKSIADSARQSIKDANLTNTALLMQLA